MKQLNQEKNDLPVQTERGVMIDIGRKFYTIEMLQALIDYMETLKMNVLQLHFSENEGFRLECQTMPELTSKEYLTKKDITSLIHYADVRNIMIIPEFDSPGHLKRLLTLHPEFQMSTFAHNKGYLDDPLFDITNPQAVRLIKEIIQEYIELFSTTHYFHLGADEYLNFNELANYPLLQANAQKKYKNKELGYDLFIDYINELADKVEENGLIARVWNDGFYKTDELSKNKLKSTIQITYWTHYQKQMATVQTFIEKGHKILNFNDNFFYFVLGEEAGYKYPTGEKIKENWTINVFSGNQQLSKRDMRQVIGTYFAIWSDNSDALTETEVLTRIKEPLKEQQKKIWQY